MFLKLKIGKPELNFLFFHKIASFDVISGILLFPIGQLLDELAFKVGKRAALDSKLQENGNKNQKRYLTMQTGRSSGDGACSVSESRICSLSAAFSLSNS